MARALQGALPLMLGLLLIPVPASTAATIKGVKPAATSAGSEVGQAGWLVRAAAQPASIGQAAAAGATAAETATSGVHHHNAARGPVAASTAATHRLSAAAVRAALREGRHPIRHHPRRVRLLPPGSLLRLTAAERVAAAVAAPLVHAASGAVHKKSRHGENMSSSSSSGSVAAVSVPSSRVLVASEQQGSSTNTSSPGSGGSSGTAGCNIVVAHDGPPSGLNLSTQTPTAGSDGGSAKATVSGTQAPSPTQQPAGSTNSSSSVVLAHRSGRGSGLQAGDIVVRGGSDGSWRCIRRPGCKPAALPFGTAFRPLVASGECQLLGGCGAVQQRGACSAPFSWEVDRRAAAVVQYCGEQCKCPGEN